ncbi:MAG: response regulator [Lysobacterales bacterium]
MSQPFASENWDQLRHMDLEQLRRLTADNNSPRHHLFLALLEVDDDAIKAARHLSIAFDSASPSSDEARLAGILKCSFAELLGSPLEASVCDERGESLTKIEHPLPAAIGQIHFGIWLAINGRHESAFNANRVAEELALAAGDTQLAASTQNNLGVDYLMRGLPVQALKKFQAALEHVRGAEDSNNQTMLTMLTSNIASTHLELGDYETASELLKKLTNSDGYDRNNPANLMDEAILARASLALGNPQEGYDRLRAVLNAVGVYGVAGNQAYAHTVVGELQIAIEQVDEALESFALAKKFAERSGDPLQIHRVDLSYTDALIGLERYADAEEVVEACIDALTQIGPSMLLSQALHLRGDLLRAAGQRMAASKSERQARQMQLRIAGAEHDLELVALGKSLELANQSNQLASAREQARLNEERAKNEVTLRHTLTVMAALLAFITYLSLSRRYERKVAKTIQNANADLEAKVNERTAALEREMAERLAAESERQLLAQNLAESEKLQALGQLTSGIAHDFNNLMTVVTLSAGELRDVVPAGSEAIRDVDNILSAAESATDITGSLLAYVRKQPLIPQPTRLDLFLAESLPLLESTLGTSMTLDTDIQTCTIRVDRGTLTTSIINLLLNAREAQDEQGAVRLTVKEQVQINKQGEPIQWIAISVADQGEGMTGAQLRRATEPFYTTKASGHGTGLGLSMVDGFAKQSGGNLQIDSAKGKGTVVTLLIPAYGEGETPAATPVDQTPEIPAAGIVMIADDQPVIREVLCRLLEQMGLETHSASSGAEALEMLEQSERPDLLITDLMMPGEINGQQLTAEVRRRFSNLPVLIMSGYTDSVELDVEFLHKPFSFEDLRNAIARTIAQSRQA